MATELGNTGKKICYGKILLEYAGKIQMLWFLVLTPYMAGGMNIIHNRDNWVKYSSHRI